MDKTFISVRGVDAAVLERLRKYSKKEGRILGFIVNEALSEYLDRVEFNARKDSIKSIANNRAPVEWKE